MRKALYRAWARFLTAFGNVKVFRWPMFAVYDPDDYAVTGEAVQDAVELLVPGDVLLRGYVHYLDGMFIPGDYSHAGVYVGDGTVVHAVAKGVSRANVLDFLRCDRAAVLRPRRGRAEAV